MGAQVDLLSSPPLAAPQQRRARIGSGLLRQHKGTLEATPDNVLSHRVACRGRRQVLRQAARATSREQKAAILPANTSASVRQVARDLLQLRKLKWKAIGVGGHLDVRAGLTSNQQLLRPLGERLLRPEPLGHPLYALAALGRVGFQELSRLQDQLALPLVLLVGATLEFRVLSQASHYEGRADVLSIMAAMDCLLVPRLLAAVQRRRPRAVREKESRAKRALVEGLVVLAALLGHHWLWMRALWGPRVNWLLALPAAAEVVRRLPSISTERKLDLLSAVVPFLSGGGILAQVVAQGQLWENEQQAGPTLFVSVLAQAALVPLLLSKINLVQLEARGETASTEELKLAAKQLIKKGKKTVQRLRQSPDLDDKLEEDTDEDEVLDIDIQTIGSSLPAVAQQLLLFALVKVAMTTQMQLLLDG